MSAFGRLARHVLAVFGLALAATPALAQEPAGHSPDLSREVFYHIFVRSYRDSNGDRIGDLNGIASRIGYLKSLGVTSVLLTPLYPSRTYHNYFATSFDGIEPAYGSMADFGRLVKALHRAGIKLVLDMEFQYVVEGHPWWNEAAADPFSPAGERILWNDRAHGVMADGPFGLRAIEHFGGDRHGVTTVNLKAPQVRAYFSQYLAGWIDPNRDGRFDDGVDGFRLDHIMDDLDGRGVLTDLFAEFWQPLFQQLHGINPALAFIGEQADWNDTGAAYLGRADATAIFAFRIQQAIRAFDKSALVAAIAAVKAAAPLGKHQLLFAENHDIDRTASDGGISPEKLRTAAALVFLLKGTPIIYQGQELGMKGARDSRYKTDEAEIPLREAFKWSAIDAAAGQATWYRRPGARYWEGRQARDHDGISVAEQSGRPGSLLERYRTLARLRHRHAVLRTGDQTVLESPPTLLVIRRRLGRQCLFIVVNLSPQQVRFDRPTAHGPDLIAGGGADLRPWQTALFAPAASSDCASGTTRQKRMKGM